jgi:rubrerythrin
MAKQMKQEPSDIGMNRTGIALSPVDSKKLIEGAQKSMPSKEGDAHELTDLRNEYFNEGLPVGSMPPPASLKGVASTAMEMFKGKVPTVFLDKLGERLAFERTGTRLYEALIAKVEARSESPATATKKLREIHDEEALHFEMLTQTMSELGADPTAVTPCADVSGVASLGLLQVLTDPRTTVTQSLHAILTAELVDVDGWTLLIKMADQMGHKELSQRFREAEEHEREHLAFIRALLSELTLSELDGKTPSF